MKRRTRGLGATAAGLAIAIALAPEAAQAQTADGFWKGKTVTIGIGSTAGGGVDLNARLYVRYMGKYLPGNPQMVPQIVPGAGGVRLLEQLNTLAPKDGTFIGALASGPLIEPLTSSRTVSYKLSDFTAVGAPAKDVSLCATWHTSPVKSLADAKSREVTVAGTGAGSATDTFPLVLNAALGTKFRVITGYNTQAINLAIESGETDGRCSWPWNFIKSTKPDWVRDKRLNFLVQLSFEPEPDLKGVPMALDLATDPVAKQMLRVMFAPQEVSRPYLAPPGVPAERARELRRAFMDTMKDPDFLAEFQKIYGEPPKPTSGEDMQKLIVDLYATPANVVDRLKAILKY